MQSKRILLRRFLPTDLRDLYAYAAVDGVGEQAGWPHHKSMEESKRILDRFIEQEEVWAIVERQSNRVIGSIGLHHRPDEEDHQPGDLVLGYVLSKDYWGQGIMTEAGNLVLKHAFEAFGVPRIRVAHFKQNIGSQRVIEKLGFSYVKDGLYQATLLNKVFEERKYVMTKDDYINRSKSASKAGT